MTEHNDCNAQSPALSLSGRIAWMIRFSEVMFDDPPYLVIQATPIFPGCHDKLAERGIVWNIFALLESAKRPGAHQVITADCGYPPDVYLNESIQVSHPDDNTIVWEMDIPGLRPALNDMLIPDQQGFIRLTFARDAYESSIRALLHELQRCARTPVHVHSLTDEVFDLKGLRKHYPDVTLIQVGALEPDESGLALEHVLALDTNAP